MARLTTLAIPYVGCTSLRSLHIPIVSSRSLLQCHLLRKSVLNQSTWRLLYLPHSGQLLTPFEASCQHSSVQGTNLGPVSCCFSVSPLEHKLPVTGTLHYLILYIGPRKRTRAHLAGLLHSPTPVFSRVPLHCM